MKFERIKQNVEYLVSSAFLQWENVAILGRCHPEEGFKETIDVIVPFVLSVESSCDEIRNFVASFISQNGEWVSTSVAARDDAMREVAFRARMAAVALIDKWEVHEVGELLELFPNCIRPKLRGKPLRVYQAGNGKFNWMVEFG